MHGQDGEQAVVIPAIATASSTAAIRSIGRHGLETVVVSEHDDPPGFRSRYCDEQVRVPDPVGDMAGYEQALLSLAGREDVDTILPFREADIYALARNREEFAEHVGTPWPDLDTLRSVQDRIELRDVAAAAGVAMPETRTLEEWTSWDRPSVVKPRYTVHAPEYAAEFGTPTPELGSAIYVPAGTEPDFGAITGRMDHVPIAQEFVPTTDEYGFFAQYEEGSPVATFQHRQKRGLKYAGGPSAYRESVSIPELEAAGLALLDELDWHGVAMVEFLRNPETGEFELMEINPRFWSSLPFTVQAGVDFPYLYWLQATGRALPDPPQYRVGIGGHLLRGEVLHLYSILTEEYPLVEAPSFFGTAREIGRSLLREPRFDYLSWDDPGPMLRELELSVRSILEGVLDGSRERVSTVSKGVAAGLFSSNR